MSKTRIEKDALGEVHVPSGAYFGAFTVRASENFDISGITAPPEFRCALGIVKKAAALANRDLKELEPAHAGAIIKAADEFLKGKFDSEFNLDVFQAGAGTPFNMNANEIIANRTNEILGGQKGSYHPVTPNNHVNAGQSSNDVIPTAIRIAALTGLENLLPEIKKLVDSLQKKSREFKNILKIGRSHLQDAVPVTLGQEFAAYASSITRGASHIKEAFSKLNEIPLGGTALGTGITAHPRFKTEVTKHLNSLTGLKLKSSRCPMELNSNLNVFALASNSLQLMAGTLIGISDDLIILNSGPKGGLNEINLPEVEPGSSVMPGKVNPSIAECVSMIGFQITGNNLAINSAVRHSRLELNVMTPVIMFNLLWSMQLLGRACRLLREKCVTGITANRENCQKLLDQSLCTATGLSPYLGYTVTASLVKESLQKKQTLLETVADKKFMKESELKKILSAKTLTAPHKSDKALIKKIKSDKNYLKYLKKT